jgi:hypothetical protein
LLSSVLNCGSIIMKTLKIVFFFFISIMHGLKSWHDHIDKGGVWECYIWLLFLKVFFT